LGDLTGLSFLDVGCGSGLSSLAALTLGAGQVMAFDLDAGATSRATTTADTSTRLVTRCAYSSARRQIANLLVDQQDRQWQ
jgi:ribosomal protein L11 methylase PrmA